jgi:ABC-type sugar transport system ATPase subunit
MGIATVYQDPELAPDLSIAENVFMGALPVKKKGLVDWRKLYEVTGILMTELGMQRNPKEHVSGLGVAERQFIHCQGG